MPVSNFFTLESRGKEDTFASWSLDRNHSSTSSNFTERISTSINRFLHEAGTNFFLGAGGQVSGTDTNRYSSPVGVRHSSSPIFSLVTSSREMKEMVLSSTGSIDGREYSGEVDMLLCVVKRINEWSLSLQVLCVIKRWGGEETYQRGNLELMLIYLLWILLICVK